MAASSLAYIIRSSLGPNGLAKLIIDEHGKYVPSKFTRIIKHDYMINKLSLFAA